jgi:GNAT superfamily N-acetyltransferase
MKHGGSVAASCPITLTFAPVEQDFIALFRALEQDTALEAGQCRIEPVALLLHDDRHLVIGGLWGRIVYNWLVVEMLVVPAAMRGTGLGTALMGQAEAVARDRCCVGLHLTRLDFQAPAFYERLGFSIFGQQNDVPPGHTCFYLQKTLGPRPISDPTARPELHAATPRGPGPEAPF